MTVVVVAETPVHGTETTALAVRVVDAAPQRSAKCAHLEAFVKLSIADPTLARAMTGGVAAALHAVAASLPAPAVRVVRVRTRKRLATLERDELSGRIAIVSVPTQNARRLPELVDAIRAAGVLAVQVVWNGADPAPEQVSQPVFAMLERARATPAGPPVVLARTDEPTFAVRALAERERARRETQKTKGPIPC